MVAFTFAKHQSFYLDGGLQSLKTKMEALPENCIHLFFPLIVHGVAKPTQYWEIVYSQH